MASNIPSGLPSNAILVIASTFKAGTLELSKDLEKSLFPILAKSARTKVEIRMSIQVGIQKPTKDQAHCLLHPARTAV